MEAPGLLAVGVVVCEAMVGLGVASLPAGLMVGEWRTGIQVAVLMHDSTVVWRDTGELLQLFMVLAFGDASGGGDPIEECVIVVMTGTKP
jgi:hypothetical protein